MDAWDSDKEKRLGLMKMGITQLFVANNRTVTDKMMDAKANLLFDSLNGLATNKILEFFKYLRENSENMPSDAQIMKVLRTMHAIFSETANAQQIGNDYSFNAAERKKVVEWIDKNPEHKGFFTALLEDDEPYPSDEWHKKFMRGLAGLSK